VELKAFCTAQKNKDDFGFGLIFVFINADQTKLDKAINDLRDNLKKKMDRIRDIEGKPALKGFNLKPLNSDEFKAISQTFGPTS
jgi:hypothetical protein